MKRNMNDNQDLLRNILLDVEKATVLQKKTEGCI